MEGHLFQFALLFGVLGLAAAVSLSVRLPVVPLYIASGVALGLFLEPDAIVTFLGKLGVVFLLFSMGLEFSAPANKENAGRFLRAGGIDWAVNFPIGLLAGLAMGWTWTESLFLAGIVYMSSSAVVSKCIADFGRAARPETETILGIMVFEDLVIAVYLVLLNALVLGADETAGGALLTLGRSAVFVGLLIALARRFQEPLARLLAHRSEEGFTLALFSFVLLIASAAESAAGLSEAIGAFLAGLVLGSTSLKERASSTLLPFQTLFAALFFVSFGMELDLASMPAVALPGALLIVVGAATKTIGGYLAGRSVGHAAPQAAVVGLSLVPKGEFSVVIAAIAASVTGSSSHITALTGLYVFVLSIIGPIGMREADRLAGLILRTRPAPAPTPPD